MAEMTARNMALDACYWIRDNGETFKKLMAVMHRQVDLGNPCAKQGEIEFYARETGIELDVVGVFRHNRNLYPALTRYMVMLRPRLARTINFRRSKLDQVDLASLWHEVVNPATVFLAENRMEAERMVASGDAAAA